MGVEFSKVGLLVNRGFIRRLWLECRNTDESENESLFNMRFSKLGRMKDLVALLVHLCVEWANWIPKAVYV